MSLFINLIYYVCLWILQSLRTPKSGSGTEDGEETASSWAFYEDMHAVLGGTPALDPPVLVASKVLGDPVPLLLVSFQL